MPTKVMIDGRDVARVVTLHIARRLDADAPTWRRLARRHVTRPLIRHLRRI